MKLRIPFFLATLLAVSVPARADEEPAQEASVMAVAKAMPAVVNINTESIVQRTAWREK